MSANTIGTLQELCTKNGYPMPFYMFTDESGEPHQPYFTMTCQVGELHEKGKGNTKQEAKREASRRMIERLSTSEPTRVQAESDNNNVHRDMLNRKVDSKINMLNADARRNIASFYWKFQGAQGDKLVQLLNNNLQDMSNDYVTVLEELSVEQKFEVHYVEMDEKTDTDLMQGLVQISSVPVAICGGIGSDIAAVREDAAKNALNFLKIMVKKIDY